MITRRKIARQNVSRVNARRNTAPQWEVCKEEQYGIPTILLEKGQRMNNKPINDIRIPSGNEYDPVVAISIRRRQHFEISENSLIVNSRYDVGGMRYRVNSIFDTDNTSGEDALKRLMLNEADGIS